jgi:hypothetical protein
MQLSGKILEILPIVTGQGNNGEWKRQEVILETEGQYPKKVCVSLWGTLIDQTNLAAGQEVDMQIDIESRPFNNKWYTNVKAYRVDIISKNMEAERPSQIEPPNFETNEDDGDVLPF